MTTNPTSVSAAAATTAAKSWTGQAAVWSRSPVVEINNGNLGSNSKPSKLLGMNVETRTYNNNNDIVSKPTTTTTVTIKVMASSVNMSDVKMTLGLMPFVQPPIVSGRDYAGMIVDVNSSSSSSSNYEHWIGTEVFGTGGSIGMFEDGSHSQYMTIELNHDDVNDNGDDKIIGNGLTVKPPSLRWEEAGSLGVPYVTAYDALVQKANVQPNDIVVIPGANGMVGRAALSLAKNVLGATTVALVRRMDFVHPLMDADHIINISDLQQKSSSPSDGDMTAALSVAISEATRSMSSTPADVFFDTIGGDMTTMGISLLAPHGRLVMISSPNPSSMATFNVFEFYRKQLSLYGCNSICPSNIDSTKAMQFLAPYFADGTLRPLPLHDTTFSLDDLSTAFDLVKQGTATGRVVVLPWKASTDEN